MITYYRKAIGNLIDDNTLHQYYLKRGNEWCVHDTIEIYRDNYIGFGDIKDRKTYGLKTALYLQTVIPGSVIVGVSKE